MLLSRHTLLIGGGLAALALLLRAGPRGAQRTITAAAMRAVLPARSVPYVDAILDAAARRSVSPLLIWAIMEIESASGTALVPQGPGGTSPDGEDLGLMQINRRAHPAFIAKLAPDGSPLWQNPRANIDYGASVVQDYARILRDAGVPRAELLISTLAAYNAGPGNVLRARREGRDLTTVTAAPWYIPRALETLATIERALGTRASPLGRLARIP